MTDPSWTWEDAAAVVVALAIGGAVLTITVQTVVTLGGLRATGLDSPPAYVAAACFYLFMIGAVAYYVARRSSWAALGIRPAALHWYAVAILLLVLSLGSSVLIGWAQTALGGMPLANPQAALLAGDSPLTPARLLWLLPLVALLAPCAEELLFRGMLQPLLRRTVHWGAVAVGALLFTLAHPLPPLMPSLFVLGLCLGVLRERSGSILPGILLHGAQNAIVLVAMTI